MANEPSPSKLWIIPSRKIEKSGNLGGYSNWGVHHMPRLMELITMYPREWFILPGNSDY
jgi:hypothetical protein